MKWLSTPETTVVIPVYQRQYRWDIGQCEQLLNDIRQVGAAPLGSSHFLGSILSAQGPRANGMQELVLIDGQQRMTTLMLFVAALRHTAAQLGQNPGNPAAEQMRSEMDLILFPSAGSDSILRIRPHRAWAQQFEDVVRTGSTSSSNRFADNYAFFRSQISNSDIDLMWQGLQRLEHVAITLGASANAQQVFESLNSTGEPLRDHELIHNYVLMGLSHQEQNDIENTYWLPIEAATGEGIAKFWQHAMIVATGREVTTSGDHGVYAAFRQRFPQVEVAELHDHGKTWLRWAQSYELLLQPGRFSSVELRQALEFVPVCGQGIIPLLMLLLDQQETRQRTEDDLIKLISQVESLMVRREIVGIPVNRLAARLCRAAYLGDDELHDAIARIMPSDERVRVALAYSALPHARYILGRLFAEERWGDFGVDHVVPLIPAETWDVGDGRTWNMLTEDEQNSFRTLAPTLGNLTLVHEDQALQCLEASFPMKRDVIYLASDLPATRSITKTPVWTTTAISQRTAQLAMDLLRRWPRAVVRGIDDDGLTPILDTQRRHGWPRGWEREFEYVEYRGEHWEVHDVRALFHRVFQRAWADNSEQVLAFSTKNGGPVYPAPSWNGPWVELNANSFLYGGWDGRYMMGAVQGILLETGIASEVFVKYSYVAAYM